MRIRRLSAVFWMTCILAFLFILYVVTDLSFKLPSIKPAPQELDEIKWSNFESKLRHLEEELNQHHAVVGEIKSAVDQIVVQSEYHPPQVRPKEHLKVEQLKPHHPEPKIREYKAVGDEPPRMRIKLNESTCPIQLQKTPKTDVQMLSMYERITFEDKDGGVWKQGWNIEYNEDQWNSKNKLKVFIVPHSHNDPGWLKTFENYYKTQTKAIFTNMVEKLAPAGRKFIWAETSYLALWWTNDATDKEKAAFRDMLHSGKIEIVTGGWVMNDEANAHWLSIAEQLTTGHQWLVENLGYVPRNGWAIDPFGHSSTQPYLLKLAGLDNSVIQRVHYRIKKELALNRQLEFHWRQLWDGSGKTDMFTHMMPFYSYDVPHTCGPDPKVCCQFDFRRLPGNGVTCPWGVPPKKVIDKNVQERTSLILDQWRKKSQLYRSSVVLVPLGDDFRYDRATEWDHQYTNYEALIEHINAHDEYNAEVQFGTLADYFRAVHAETRAAEFPALSGDFFTYADRGQHYWSGYYTSRPFYKAMDRVLGAYVRAAETITAQAVSGRVVSALQAVTLRDRVEAARRALALFQHHDGITGTERDEVRNDYADKMLAAIKQCQSAIQQTAYSLLQQPSLAEQTQDDIYMEVDDVWRANNELPSRITIALDAVAPARTVVVYNALTYTRREIITVVVSTPHIEVFDSSGSPIMSQVSPAVAAGPRLGLAAHKYLASWPANIPALGLTSFTVCLRDVMAINKHTSYARVRIYNADYWAVELPKMFVVEQVAARLDADVTLQAGGGTRALVTKHGLLKALVSPEGGTTPLHMDYVQYGSQKAMDNNSGAYLFLPDGPARALAPPPAPEMVLVEGIHRATLYVAHQHQDTANIMIEMNVYNESITQDAQIEISTTVTVDPRADDVEVALRLASNVQNGRTFYTDASGMQMVRRAYLDKLPLQGNFYPLPGAAYIEDHAARLTILTSTPLGVAALRPGEIQVMQDRRLSRDDNRGLNQGVMDNVRTRHTARLLLERAQPCQKLPTDYPGGFLTLGAHAALSSLLQPPLLLQYTPAAHASSPTYSRARIDAADVTLAAARAHATALGKDGSPVQGIGLTLQRTQLSSCYGAAHLQGLYSLSDGTVSIADVIEPGAGAVHSTTLTFNRVGAPLPDKAITLCPMEIRSVFLPQRDY